MQKKSIKEVMGEVYDQGYIKGKADAYAEMVGVITFLSKTACKALRAEIKEAKEKAGIV